MDTLTTPISDAHLSSLGRLTVNFAILEDRVAHLIWTLLSTRPGQAQVVTAELSFRMLVKVSKALYRLRVADPERLARLKEVMKAASAAERDRNSLTHSLWLAGSDDKDNPWRTKLTADAKDGLGIQNEQVPVAKIDEVSLRCAEVAFAVLKLEQEFWEDEQGRALGNTGQQTP